jgi:hypothetical protein
MANYRRSRIFPIALILIIVAVSIAAMISLVRVVFFNNSSTNTTTVTSQADIGRQALISTTAGREVDVIVRGPIVADEDFHSYAIKITPSSRSLTTYNGYLDRVVDNVSLGNNIPAYEELVYSLDNANLAKGTELVGDKNDTRGICASGSLYAFSIIDSGKPIETLWTSTCSGSRGSLNANVNQLMTLFQDQIPNSDKLIGKIKL